jgi:cystathionine beta-lyase/cystathionine gamma-synthase
VLPKCAGIPPENFNTANGEHHLIRLYTGLEEPEALIADLDAALQRV